VRENESAEANAALVRRLFDEVYNAGRLDVADEPSPRVREPQPTPPRGARTGGIKAAAGMQRRALPDQVTIDDLIAQGDRVAVRGRDIGTHTGEPYAGIEATGQRFEITWIDIFRVEDDKLVEAWLEIDVSFRRQLEA
jgi:predicted ester cyclase